MSRVGKMPIAVPAGVTVEIAENNKVTVKGPKGELSRVLPEAMDIKQEGEEIIVTRPNDLKKNRALHGLTRALINNMVVGVTEGFSKALQINGVGYKAQKQGKKVVFNLGYSHPIEIEEPAGITIEVPDQNNIIVKGADKQLVGETAAKIRSFRVPDVYKGKGIKYAGEHLIIKEGKTGAKK